jgi:RNA polymerase sigma-B factor
VRGSLEAARPWHAHDVAWLFEHYAVAHDPVARELLVRHHIPLARRLATRYASLGREPLEDLFQVACVGLLKAIERFDAGRGCAFKSFAIPTIVGELKRYYRDATWSVHASHSERVLAIAVKQTADALTVTLGHPPSLGQLADAVGADEDKVAAALKALAASVMLSMELACDDDGEISLGDTVGVWDEGYLRVEQRAELDDVLRFLTARERIVMLLRFRDELTQRQIGDRLGMSQMAVSRLLRRLMPAVHALADLRRESVA